MTSLRIRAFLLLLVALAAPSVFAQAPADQQSLTSSQLVDRGMPEPDRVWTRDDFDRAVDVLDHIEDRSQWPRSGSKMFDRLVSPENFVPLADAKLPLSTRLVTFMSMLHTYGATISGYVSLLADGKKGYDVELVDLMSAILASAVPGMRVSREFIDQLDPSDPTFSTRREGYEKMRGGLGEIVSGAITSVGERDAYRTSERLRLARNIALALPDLFGDLSVSSQRDISLQIEEIETQEPDANVKTVLHDLQVQLAARKPASK